MVSMCLIWLATTPLAAQTCTKTFTPPAGALAQLSWHVDEHWSPAGVPGPADIACIFDGGMYEVRVDQPVTVAGLRLDAASEGDVSLKIIATDFTLNGPGLLAGSTKLKVNDGAVLRSDSAAELEARSKLVIEGGTVAVDVDLYGHLNWWGPASVTGLLTTHPGSIIEVEEAPQPAHLSFDHGFTVNGVIRFNDLAEQSVSVASGRLEVAAGGSLATLRKAGSGTVVPELAAELDNYGVVDVDGLDLQVFVDGAVHLNRGGATIQVADADLVINLGSPIEVPSNFTNYGSITVASGGSVKVYGSAGSQEVPSNFTNYGSITVAHGGSVRVEGGRDEAAMAVINAGVVDLADTAVFELVDVDFTNPAAGELSGAGTLAVTAAGVATFDGALVPGPGTGIFTIDGDIAEGSPARVFIDIDGETPGVGHDRLNVTGALTAAGTIDIDLAPSYQPVGGERFEVLHYGSLNGEFDAIELPSLQHLLAWTTDQSLQSLALEVRCNGTQLTIELAVDNDPVSVGDPATYLVTVHNDSPVAASSVVVTDRLPAGLSFNAGLSSPQCVPSGGDVECAVGSLAPSEIRNLTIVADAMAAGQLVNTVEVDSWECDVAPHDNLAQVQSTLTNAARCDADFDLSIDQHDVTAAAAHVFGSPAAGNPDCRLGGGITADDLAAIIVAAQ